MHVRKLLGRGLLASGLLLSLLELAGCGGLKPKVIEGPATPRVALPGVRQLGAPFATRPPLRPAVSPNERQNLAARFRRPEARSTPRPPRVCRQDSFFVEVPGHVEPTPWDSSTFVGYAAQDLLRSATATCGGAASWFDGTACPNHVEVHAVLPKRSAPAPRQDGHLRFFRLSFQGEQGPIDVRTDRTCAVVESLRTLFLARARQQSAPLRTWIDGQTDFEASDVIRVGRDCEGAGAQTPPTPASPVAPAWHLAALGLTGPAPQLPGVDIAIVDSGIPEIEQLATEWPPGPVHPHGGSVRTLIAEVAPGATLSSYRVLDANGVGSTERLARGLDRAVTDAFEAQRPRIHQPERRVDPGQGRAGIAGRRERLSDDRRRRRGLGSLRARRRAQAR